MTIKDLADKLGEKPDTIYYRITRYGLIEAKQFPPEPHGRWWIEEEECRRLIAEKEAEK